MLWFLLGLAALILIAGILIFNKLVGFEDVWEFDKKWAEV